LVGWLILAAGSASAEPTLTSSETFAQAVSKLSGEVGEDGGSIDDVIAHYGGSMTNAERLTIDRALADFRVIDYEYGGVTGGDVATALGLSSDTEATTFLAESISGVEGSIDGSTNEAAIDTLAGDVESTVSTGAGGSVEAAAGGGLTGLWSAAGGAGTVGGNDRRGERHRCAGGGLGDTHLSRHHHGQQPDQRVDRW
jgi:hypothetical protein